MRRAADHWGAQGREGSTASNGFRGAAAGARAMSTEARRCGHRVQRLCSSPAVRTLASPRRLEPRAVHGRSTTVTRKYLARLALAVRLSRRNVAVPSIEAFCDKERPRGIVRARSAFRGFGVASAWGRLALGVCTAKLRLNVASLPSDLSPILCTAPGSRLGHSGWHVLAFASVMLPRRSP